MITPCFDFHNKLPQKCLHGQAFFISLNENQPFAVTVDFYHFKGCLKKLCSANASTPKKKKGFCDLLFGN